MTEFQKQSKEEFEKKVKELETRDWNKDWPSATREAPKVCSGCGRKLEKPSAKPVKFEPPIFSMGREVFRSQMFNNWRIDCKCGVCYIWKFPNVWARTHRTVELMMYINEDGSLLIPPPVNL